MEVHLSLLFLCNDLATNSARARLDVGRSMVFSSVGKVSKVFGEAFLYSPFSVHLFPTFERSSGELSGVSLKSKKPHGVLAGRVHQNPCWHGCIEP